MAEILVYNKSCGNCQVAFNPLFVICSSCKYAPTTIEKLFGIEGKNPGRCYNANGTPILQDNWQAREGVFFKPQPEEAKA